MRAPALLSLAVLLAAACDEPPEDACTVLPRPPAPQRVVVEDCAGLVDVESLPPPADPLPCPATDPPVASLCPAGGSAEGAVVESQAQLEAYRGCSEIAGRLTIAGSVCSLAPLSDVVRITGSLEIVGDEEGGAGPSIVDLSGLSSLAVVEQSFTLRGLPALASLDGLDSLQTVGFDFELFQLPALVHLTGPATLTAVGGDLNVGFSGSLVLVDGFDGLTSVGDDLGFRTFSGVRFQHSSNLLCVGGFSSLEPPREIELGDVGALSAAPGLVDAIGEGTTLKLIDTPAFDVLTLPPLEALGGLVLVRPAPMEDLRFLSGVARIGELSLHQTNLSSLGGVDDVTSIDVLELGLDASRDVSALSSASVRELRVRETVAYDLRCALPETTALEHLSIARTDLRTIEWPRSLVNVGDLVVEDNEALADLGSASFVIGDARIAFNSPITNAEVEAWLAERQVEGVAKYGSNPPQARLDPCPWIDDGACDLDLCVADSEADCPPIED